MCRFLWTAGVVALAMPLARPAAAPLPQQEKVVVARFVDAAAAYVRRYQTELNSIIADERYVQQVRAQTPRHGDTPLETTLQSEVFFMFPDADDWMTIRDVRLVDGVEPEARPDIRKALSELPPAQVAARFKAYNSRFNVGRVLRNFNEPTLSLLVLDDRHRPRFEFTRAERRRGDDSSLVRLAFRERRTPTLVRHMNGGAVYSSGDITMDPESGQVHAIRMQLSFGSVKVMLETDYAIDPGLKIAVPVRFTEHYEDGRKPRDRDARSSRRRYEEIACEATYSNFRRFSVQTRIR